MKSNLILELSEVMEVIQHKPAISIIMPFNPKMVSKSILVKFIKGKLDRLYSKLEENYPEEVCDLMIQKLNKLVNELNFSTHKKSIAIFVSPIFEKLIYLDIEVENRTIVDSSFDIKDIVRSKKQTQNYLVLWIAGNQYSVYNGSIEGLVRMVCYNAQPAYMGLQTLNQQNKFVVQAADNEKETLLDRLLLSIDYSLDIILKSYPLPVFILAPEEVIVHFKAITQHAKYVVQYLPGKFNAFSEADLADELAQYIDNWAVINQIYFKNILDDAERKNRLAAGIKEVWEEAMNGKDKLLLIDSDYATVSNCEGDGLFISACETHYNKFSYIKNAVDEIIERLLESGADVEFVDGELLKDYNKIALVK
jgi:hypothetical protein